jgi:hypothetical protein
MTRSAVLRATIAAAMVFGGAVPAVAQQPAADTVSALAHVARALQDSGAAWGEAIWPGYRPDTIPRLFVLPGRGTALFGWRGDAPPGFQPLEGAPGALFRPEADRGAASTGTTLAGRAVAQLVVSSLAFPDLLGLALHESFHVFERAVARDDRKFGGAEASWLVSRYPAFDATNEAGMALEGRILRAALLARSAADARRLAREVAAARERRYRALDPQFVEFEVMAEMNEGLAEYALERGSAFAGRRPLEHTSIVHLDSLTSAPGLSIRLRFYSTGSGIALLLDRLAGEGWKRRLVDEDLTLSEMLARVSGFRDPEDQAVRQASAAFGWAALRSDAERSVAALRAQRARQVDSLLGRPGVLVEIDGSALPGRFIGLCGFDPQNMLQAGDGVVLHTRWLRICSGAAYDGEFNTPVVQGAGNTVLRAAIGEESAVRITVGGASLSLGGLTHQEGAQDVRIESPGLTLHLARADLSRDGRTVRIKLYR